MNLRGKAHLMQQCDGAAAFSAHTGERRSLRGRKKKGVHCGACGRRLWGVRNSAHHMERRTRYIKAISRAENIIFWGAPDDAKIRVRLRNLDMLSFFALEAKKLSFSDC